MAGVKLVIKRGEEAGVSAVPVADGQLIFAQDTGRLWLDGEAGRVEVAGGAVKSINGEKPDADGNVNISTDVEGVVKSINGEKPDADGNVSLDIGTVKSVNGVEPDADGNVTISTGEGSGAEGTVKSVNGVEPDADGNVEVNVGVLTVNGIEPDADGNIKITTDSISGTSINHLVIQRPTSDMALYPYVEASESPDYDNSIEIDLYDDYDGNASYCKVFNGDSWLDIPKSGLGTPFDGMEVEIELSKFEGLNQPYYLRYGWVTSDGAYSNYKGLMFPSVSCAGSSSSSSTSIDTSDFVKSVNGEKPDADGNVALDVGTVKTVNGEKPDSDGNIEINVSETSLVRQTTVTEEIINTLYLDKDIVIQSYIIDNELDLDISSVLDGDGNIYTGQEGDVLTWELWITAKGDVSIFNLKEKINIKKLNTFPEILPLVGESVTRHVFSLRAVYDSGSSFSLKFLLNYCYSEEL